MHADAGAPVLVEPDGAVGWITLNRPAAINAINDDIRTGVPAALRALDADPAVRVIVLRGAGPRGFCAGADLREARPASSPGDDATQRRAAWFDAFDQTAKPLIAAIHGVCFGGGFEIALACDLRIASADALFALPETGLGIIPGGGGTQRLPRLVGLGAALQLLLTGERIDAQEAWRMGVVTRVLPDAPALHAEAARLAAQIAAKPPMATRLAKQAARTGLELALAAGLAQERHLFALLAQTDDCKEAAAAFREKRSPVFTGR
jgi:enoyl-CoA hydratase/carnithine racemase